ncbi:MAG: glycosyltransferase, partial [Ilumatobacteraceae bacterium]
VAAETGGLAELVVGTGSALTFEPGRAEELAARILEVLTDHELAAGLRDAARDLVEGSYSWQAIARRTLEVYRRALPS